MSIKCMEEGLDRQLDLQNRHEISSIKAGGAAPVSQWTGVPSVPGVHHRSWWVPSPVQH